MRLIFSRKGFDSGSGGAPSPIINGRPVSLPIPATDQSQTSYEQLDLGDLVEQTTGGRIRRDHLCHEDPMFIDGRCYFGQSGAALTHLRNQQVGIGDVFLFFGLFADEGTGERHHRFFGTMQIERMIDPAHDSIDPLPRPHPHMIGTWPAANCIFIGAGQTVRHATDNLRLTAEGGPLTRWRVPAWLRDTGLSYHGAEWRWADNGFLHSVSRGQEFVADISGNDDAKQWLWQTITAIRA